MESNKNNKIEDRIKKRAAEVETIIQAYLPPEEGLQKLIMESMRYSLLSGGKRLRPMLMLETYRMFGGDGRVVEPFLAAMEMIHTYSLVHDDLPAMDDDDYRRGRKTTHVVYGEAMGILAGDALLTYTFETAAKAFFMEGAPQGAARALQILAQKAGIYGMLGGQVVDVLSEDTKDFKGDTAKNGGINRSVVDDWCGTGWCAGKGRIAAGTGRRLYWRCLPDTG